MTLIEYLTKPFRVKAETAMVPGEIRFSHLKTWMLANKELAIIEVVVRHTVLPEIEKIAARKPQHCAMHVSVEEVAGVCNQFLGATWAREIATSLSIYIFQNPKPF